MIGILYWFLGLDYSLEGFGTLCLYCLLTNGVFSNQGYFLGVIFDADTANTLNVLLVMMILLPNGIVVNLNKANWLLKGWSYLSPARFITEGIVRIMTAKIPDFKKECLE